MQHGQISYQVPFKDTSSVLLLRPAHMSPNFQTLRINLRKNFFSFHMSKPINSFIQQYVSGDMLSTLHRLYYLTILTILTVLLTVCNRCWPSSLFQMGKLRGKVKYTKKQSQDSIQDYNQQDSIPSKDLSTFYLIMLTLAKHTRELAQCEPRIITLKNPHKKRNIFCLPCSSTFPYKKTRKQVLKAVCIKNRNL